MRLLSKLLPLYRPSSSYHHSIFWHCLASFQIMLDDIPVIFQPIQVTLVSCHPSQANNHKTFHTLHSMYLRIFDLKFSFPKREIAIIKAVSVQGLIFICCELVIRSESTFIGLMFTNFTPFSLHCFKNFSRSVFAYTT